MDQYQVQYRFGTIYRTKMFKYIFSFYKRIQLRLTVILSILARAFASQKRKTKPLKINQEMEKFGLYIEKCA